MHVRHRLLGQAPPPRAASGTLTGVEPLLTREVLPQVHAQQRGHCCAQRVPRHHKPPALQLQLAPAGGGQRRAERNPIALGQPSNQHRQRQGKAAAPVAAR